MRTTLDIPKELIDEAMKATGAKTKSQLIKDALQAAIDLVKRKRLITKKGTVDLHIDLDRIRDRTCCRDTACLSTVPFGLSISSPEESISWTASLRKIL